MKRPVPYAVLVSIVLLGIVSAVQLVLAAKWQSGTLLAAVLLNVAIMFGLRAGHRWAYVALLVTSVLGVGGQLVRSAAAGFLTLLFNGVICGPVLLSTDFFLGGQHAGESADPLRCPECGYSLLGLTTPRCPECGARFPDPR